MPTRIDNSAGNPVLSVIIPVYNEPATLAEMVRRVCQLPYSLDIVVVDDGSCKRTKGVIRDLPSSVRILEHGANRDK